MLSADDCGFPVENRPQHQAQDGVEGYAEGEQQRYGEENQFPKTVDDVDVSRENRDERGDDAVEPRKRRLSRLTMQVTSAPIIERAMRAPMPMKKTLNTPRKISPSVCESALPVGALLPLLLFDGTAYVVDVGSLAPHFELLGGSAGFGNANPQEQVIHIDEAHRGNSRTRMTRITTTSMPM